MLLVPEARDTFWLAVPLAVPFVALVGGLALALASLNVVFRDVEHLVGALLLPWFFLTPVLYSFEQIPGCGEHETLVDVLRWGNPVTPPIEALRAPLWEGTLAALADDVVYLVVAARRGARARRLGLQPRRRPDRGRALDGRSATTMRPS